MGIYDLDYYKQIRKGGTYDKSRKNPKVYKRALQ